MHFHIGKRIIKTAVTLFLIFMIYILLLCFDNLLSIDHSNWKAPSNMYTPFYAGIAAVFATHRDKKTSTRQAKTRSNGTIIGGYYGMFVLMFIEFLLLDVFLLNQVDNLILFTFIKFIFVTLAIIPLIVFTVKLKQVDAVFITCLTFLSVTVSLRNGGMPVFQFATNRVLSTLIGVGMSLFVNNVLFHLKHTNKDVLFVASLENNFLSKDDELSPFIKYKLNDLYDSEINLSFATNRTAMSFEYIFNNININYPMIIMNGASKYQFNSKRYSDVYHLENDVRNEIDDTLKVLNMNAFVYTINDHVLHAYHDKLINDGEKKFFAHRKNQNAYTFVRGILPYDLNACLYIIIDTKDRIDSFIELFNKTNQKDKVNLVIYKYRDIDNVEYYYLRITNILSNKENCINSIIKKSNTKKLIVSGSGRTDIPLIKKADLSICLNSAPDYVKEEVDIVIDGNAEQVLRIYDRLFHSYNIDLEIEKIKSKYKK